MVAMWHSTGLTSSVTYLTPAPTPYTSTSTTPVTFAVSYQDGSIRLWSYDPSTPEIEASETVTFNGHKKSVTIMTWDHDASRLASGGTEGEIVIWDRIGEVGLFRLKGHRAPITGLAFIPHPRGGHPGWLISTSRDTYLKVWDLGTQHCVQTVVVGRGEVTSLAVREEAEESITGQGEGEAEDQEEIKGRWVVVTGTGDGEAKVYTVEKSQLARGMAEDENGELPALITSVCTLPLPSSTHPISQMAWHPALPLLSLQTSDRGVAILRLRTEEEVSAKRARRKKRDREKKKKGKGDKQKEEDKEEDETDEPVKWEERVAVWCMVRANAKVKSFAFANENVVSVKGGVSVSDNEFVSETCSSIGSCFWRCPTTPSNHTLSLLQEASLSLPVELPRNPPRLTQLNFPVTDKTFEPFPSLLTIKSLLLPRLVPSSSGMPGQQRVSGRWNAVMLSVRPSCPVTGM